MAIIGVYGIQSPSGKFYVGSSVNIARRWRLHLNDLRRGAHHCLPLQNAFNKYGEAALQFHIIEECARDVLLDREQAFIDVVGPQGRYNVSPQAGSRLGAKHTDEQRARQSARMKGIIHSEETRRKLSIAHKGLRHTDAAKAKISAANTGRTWSAEHRAKHEKAAETMFRSDNKSGYRGVSKHRDKWSAKLQVRGERVFIGLYDTPEEANAAIAAYKQTLTPC